MSEIGMLITVFFLGVTSTLAAAYFYPKQVQTVINLCSRILGKNRSRSTDPKDETNAPDAAENVMFFVACIHCDRLLAHPELILLVRTMMLSPFLLKSYKICSFREQCPMI
jgi:hypothetical protein